jgi:hypothetical protein
MIRIIRLRFWWRLGVESKRARTLDQGYDESNRESWKSSE